MTVKKNVKTWTAWYLTIMSFTAQPKNERITPLKPDRPREGVGAEHQSLRQLPTRHDPGEGMATNFCVREGTS